MFIAMEIAKGLLIITGLFLTAIGIGILIREVKRWRNIIHIRRVIKRIGKEELKNAKAEVREL